jgi:hypothetical protein
MTKNKKEQRDMTDAGESKSVYSESTPNRSLYSQMAFKIKVEWVKSKLCR